jgi:hypothetical protein
MEENKIECSIAVHVQHAMVAYFNWIVPPAFQASSASRLETGVLNLGSAYKKSDAKLITLLIVEGYCQGRQFVRNGHSMGLLVSLIPTRSCNREVREHLYLVQKLKK